MIFDPHRHDTLPLQIYMRLVVVGQILLQCNDLQVGPKSVW